MKLFRTLISYDESLRIVLAHASRAEYEEIRFDDALNRVLAEDIRSPMDSPPFDRAAMDGYAIRGEDSFGASPQRPVHLRIRRDVPGPVMQGPAVQEGECVPIATGMPVPPGSNAVVMLEYTKERDSTLEVYWPVPPGKNVSVHGEDVKAGEVVLPAGRRLRAHDIGMLAMLFQRTVRVYQRATIGIISTGDELIDPRTSSVADEHAQGTRPSKIADSNSYMLTAFTHPLANPHRIGILRDDPEAIKAAIRSALEGACDALLVTGGSSVGSRDFLTDAVEALGQLLFHGVAMRPGEPTGFGIVNGRPIFVLPGYPVAAIAAFELLVRPFLLAMHSVAEERKQLFAIARKDIPSAVGRTDFVRVKLQKEAGRYYAEPIRVSGSGILSSMTKSDGFLIVAANKEGIAAGETVAVTLYE
jgi:molybdopterin molybdotransferase